MGTRTNTYEVNTLPGRALLTDFGGALLADFVVYFTVLLCCGDSVYYLDFTLREILCIMYNTYYY